VTAGAGRTDVDLPASGKITVRTLTLDDQLIETFEEEIHGANAHYVYNVASAVPLYEWTAVYTAAGNAPPSPERPLGTPRWTVTHANHVFEQPPERISLDKNASAGYRTVLEAATSTSPSSQVEMVTDEADRARLVQVHARWDAPNSPNFLGWLQLAKDQPGFDQLVDTRLKESPRDIVLLRFEQDNTTGDAHQAACKRQAAMATAAPGDSSLQYLAIRCMPDGPPQGAAFIDAQKKWPGNAWLSFAAAAAHADVGEYQEAAPLYDKARIGLPAMRDYLALSTARMRRLNSDGNYEVADLVTQSRQVALFMAIESGNQVQGTPLEPYYAMAQGDLARATSLAASLGDGSPRLVRMIAASDGATGRMMETAFAQPIEESADLESTLAMWGVAARAQRDVKPYEGQAQKLLGEQAPAVFAFLETMRSGGDPVAARATLPKVDLSVRLAAMNAVVVMLGPRSPPGWRKEVYRGLFVGERQYINPRAG
jgi:hypothetical protein